MPNCTAVAVANSAIGIVALSRAGDFIIDPPLVNQFYADTIHVPVSQIEYTGGALLLDAMQLQATKGLPSGHQALITGPFATMDPHDLGMMRTAMAFGALPILGVALSESDQNMAVWDTDAPADAGDPTPGSGGLHALTMWDYTGLADTDTVRLVTWATLQPATWRWIRQRVDETYAAVWRALMPASGITWAGLDYEQTVADLQTWGG